MNSMASAVIRQILNGFVVVLFVPPTSTEGAVETETYYATIAEASAALVAAL